MWTCGYLRYILCYNPTPFYSSNCFSLGHLEPFQLDPMSIWHTHFTTELFSFGFCLFVLCLVWVLPYLLAWQDTPGSFCIWPVPVSEPAVSPRSPGLSYWKMVRTKNWVLSVNIRNIQTCRESFRWVYLSQNDGNCKEAISQRIEKCSRE